MVQMHKGTIASTKRCLFPEDIQALADQSKDDSDGSESDYSFCNDFRDQDHSPTAVSEYPTQASRKTTSIKSTISMGDHGAEVMIDFSSLSLGTPDKIRCFRRTNSLIDNEKKLSPMSSEEPSLVYCPEDSPFTQCFQNSNRSPFGLQTSIALCLGDSEQAAASPSAACSGWQAWLYSTVEEVKIGSPRKSPFNKQDVRNRVSNLKARMSRVKQIRRDLNPFAVSPKTPKELSKSRSFSSARHYRSDTSFSPQQTMASAGLADVLLCRLPEKVESPVPIQPRTVFLPNEGECYDSDPEDFARRREKNYNGRRNIEYVKMYQGQVANTPTGKPEDIYNEGTFCTVAQEFINSTFTLIFHSKSDGRNRPSSVVVSAWVERGQSFGEAVFQPKWMWRPKPYASESQQSMDRVREIDLLKIKRVLKVDQMDRSSHPFAKPLNCFMVKSIEDEELFFETESPTERDRLVYSMKMVIARFGAMVLEQDNNVYQEFFATCEPVPGRVPDVLTRLPHS
eukprot:scaffold5653_cov147-Cylindrotheca_fusiformis.AAC.16